MKKVDLTTISRQAKSQYWGAETKTFRNTIHASIIAVWSHYANMLFGGDYSRIVYASTDFAFRERCRQTGSSNLDLPFMNFHLKGLKDGASRRWWNHVASVRGVFVPELKRTIKYIPITLDFDAVIYVHKDIDMHYAIHTLFFDDNNETLLKPSLEIDGYRIDSIGVVGYNLNPLEEYNENSFLQKNKMIANRLDVTLETYLILDNYDVSIPKKTILDFATGIGVSTDGPFSETYEGVLKEIDGEEVMQWTQTAPAV